VNWLHLKDREANQVQCACCWRRGHIHLDRRLGVGAVTGPHERASFAWSDHWVGSRCPWTQMVVTCNRKVWERDVTALRSAGRMLVSLSSFYPQCRYQCSVDFSYYPTHLEAIPSAQTGRPVEWTKP
jgi:hypothetical protein